MVNYILAYLMVGAILALIAMFDHYNKGESK